MRHLLTGAMLVLLTPLAGADGGLSVDDAWVREAPPGAPMLAAYLVIRNTGDTDARLVAVESPDFAHVMLHQTEMVGGVARMSHEDSLAIPAHGSVRLQPGGHHLMMPAPNTRLQAGDKVTFLLHFADDSCMAITAVVRKKP